jgi:exosortase
MSIASRTLSPSSSKFPQWENQLFSGYNFVFLAALIALIPLLIAQGFNLSQKLHFQFFPIAWGLFAATVVIKGVPGKTTGLRFNFGAAVGLISFLCFVVAILIYSPWMGQVAAIGFCLAWMMISLGRTPWYQPFAWLLLLLVTLPLPSNLDTKMVQQLQLLSTKSASLILDVLGTPHMGSGNILDVRTGSLFVDEACSGVDSLYALYAVATALCVWQCRSFLISLLLLLSVPLWAWLGNVVRISLIAFLLDHFQFDLSHGVGHTLLGLGLFALSTYFLQSTMRSLTYLTEPFRFKPVSSGVFHGLFNKVVCWPSIDPTFRDKKSPKTEARAIEPVERLPVGRTQWLASFIFIATGAVSLLPVLGVGPWKDSSILLPAFGLENVKSAFKRDMLGQQFNDMRCVGFDITQRKLEGSYGEFSVFWEYQNDSERMSVSLDFPFPGYHALESCYGFAGKRLLSAVEHVEFAGPPNAPTLVANQALLADDLNQESFLCYVLTDQYGKPVDESGTLNRGLLLTQSNVVSYQFQIHKDVVRTISDEDKSKIHQVLASAVEKLLPTIQALQPK